MAARVRGAFSDAKESAVPKADGGELEQAGGEEGEDADAFWGGPRDPSPSKETEQAELVEFDAMPPDRKLAALRFAERVDASSVPKEVNDLYVGESRYRIRCGRSACIYLTAQRTELYAALWQAELDGRIDAITSLHHSRRSVPRDQGDYEACCAAFERLPPDVQFAAAASSYKLKRPLPDSFEMKPEFPRDEQYYEIRVCGCHPGGLLNREQLEKLKNLSLGRMKAAEAAEAADRKNRPAQVAEAAKDKAKAIVDRLKAKAAHAGVAAKDKAKAAAKKGAKSLFWKALGY